MRKFALIVCASLWMPFAGAQVIHVPADHPTIQEAIDASTDGDTVLVAEGTYLENINFRGKAITVASRFLIDGDISHISKTVIDGSQPVYPDSASVVTMNSDEDSTSVIMGFTITGGLGTRIIFAGLGPHRAGGGVLTDDSGGKIVNNIITRNSVTTSGFQADGGGVAAVDFGNRNVVIRDNIVFDNHIVSDTYAQGGGVFTGSEGGFTLVENNYIFENTSTCTGTWKANAGGLMLGTMHPWIARMIVRNNFITENEIHCVGSQGGAIFLTFVSLGGGYQSGTSDIRIYNNVIANNYSEDRGGGIAMWDQSNVSYQVEHPNPIIYNNTIVGNKARKGAGIFNFDMNALFFNNIIWNDSENEVGEINMDRMFVPGWGNLNNYGIVQTYFNDVRGGWPGEGNMNADPLLTAESFELNEASPCIGAGVDSVEVAGNWYAAPAMDMKYSPRPNPVDAFVDMGALESGYTNPTLIQVPADQPTIQAAIDAASVGDTVLVAEGTYFENINFRGKAITVASQFLIDGDTSHISKTTIDGSQGPAGNATVVSFDGCIDTTSVLAGFTITGGKGSTKKIGNNNITSAGGISLENAGGKVINNIVRNNEIVAEGQVWAVAAGIGVINSGEEYHSVIRNNMIHDNHTLSESMTSGAGIAVYVSGGTLLIESNEVFGNISESTGNYKALGAGIDIEKDYGTEARIIIRNNHIHQNQVRCQASFGGGMYLVLIPPEGEVDLGSNVPIEIYNNIISENESEDKGGGLAIWNMAPIFGFKQTVPDPIVANNTIVNNRAADGAGIFNYDAQTILLNNILWNDLSQEGCREVFNDDINYGSDWTKNENDGTIAAFYNLIQDGWDGEGNMDTDPLLLADSYELSDSSSCIGAGVDSVQVEGVWYRAPVLDYKGSVRPNPVGSFVDMGALESTLGDPVSVKSLEAPQKFVVYPNPSKDHITLHLNNAGKYEVKLISLSGQVVHAEIFSGNQRQIDLTGLMKGIYLIKVRSDEFSAVQKIIKR